MEIGADKFNSNGYKIVADVKSPQGEADEEGQLSIVRDMINKKYSGLLLSPKKEAAVLGQPLRRSMIIN